MPSGSAANASSPSNDATNKEASNLAIVDNIFEDSSFNTLDEGDFGTQSEPSNIDPQPVTTDTSNSGCDGHPADQMSSDSNVNLADNIPSNNAHELPQFKNPTGSAVPIEAIQSAMDIDENVRQAEIQELETYFQPGCTFPDYPSFAIKFARYCLLTYTITRVNDSHKNNGNVDLDLFRYSRVQLVCKKFGHPKRSKSTGKRPNQHYSPADCTFEIFH